MGKKNRSVDRGLTAVKAPPAHDQIEVCLFGPGYGECILLHVGNGNWVIVDSCLNAESHPVATAYLHGLGLDPAEVVRFVVATHWHDDHIRGLGKLIEICDKATFCCASALCKNEFLTAVGVMESGRVSAVGSGMQEFHKVLSLLEKRSSKPIFAFSNRLILNQDGCEIWSLSPFDEHFYTFLQEIGRLLPKELETKRRISALTPNKVAVVLLVKIDDIVILLGADLENPGWLKILNAHERPSWKASVFKIPHHGAQNAHEERVWKEMLYNKPIAALAPWQRGGKRLPTRGDIKRILSFTPRAYTTASHSIFTRKPVRRRSGVVERMIKETGAKFRRIRPSSGIIRLRKKRSSRNDWDVQLLGSACKLADSS